MPTLRPEAWYIHTVTAFLHAHSYLIRNPDRLVRGLADFSGHS